MSYLYFYFLFTCIPWKRLSSLMASLSDLVRIAISLITSSPITYTMPKVLMLLSNPFRPDPRVYREARTLVDSNYQVIVLAWDRELKYAEVETVDGILIKRIRVRSQFDNFFDMLVKLPIFWRKAFFRARKMQVDIVHCHDLDTLLIGIIIAKLKGAKIIYDAHEIYSAMVQDSVPKFFQRLIDKLEACMIKRVDLIITVSSGLADIFGGHDAKNISVILNCPDLKIKSSEEELKAIRKSLGVENKMFILYIGALERGRSLEELVTVFSRREDVDMVFVIGGFGILEEKLKSLSKQSKNIRFIGFVNPEDVPNYTFAADVLILLFDPNLLDKRLGLPNKIFEAMSAGKPIVVSKGTAGGDLVEKEGSGIAIPYSDTDKLVQVLVELKNNKELYDRLSKKSSQLAKEKYNWTIISQKLLELYKKL